MKRASSSWPPIRMMDCGQPTWTVERPCDFRSQATSLLTPRWKGRDGKRVIYVTNENGQPDVWEYNLEAGTKAAITTSPLEEETLDVSLSGDVVVADTVEQTAHLWSVDPAGTSSPIQLTNDSRSDLWPSISLTDRLLFHRRKGSFVQFTPEDTELVSARWSGGQFTLGDVIGPGAAGGISPDGHRVFFLRPPDTSQMSALWVKDLDTPSPAVKLWDRVFFPAHHIDTWAPLGQSVAWAPNGLDRALLRAAGAVKRAGLSSGSGHDRG